MSQMCERQVPTDLPSEECIKAHQLSASDHSFQRLDDQVPSDLEGRLFIFARHWQLAPDPYADNSDIRRGQP
jgi:hypothetical protein